MFNLFRMELKRALWNPRWGLVALMALVSFAAGWLQLPGSMRSTYGALDLWMLIVNYGMHHVAALMAALPYGDALLMDSRQGMLRSLCLRAPYRACLTAKLLANACAGALAVSLPVALLAGGLLLIIPPQTGGPVLTAYQPGYPLDPLNFLFQRPFLYLASLILLIAAFGAVYASLAMALSTWINNAAWVLVSPLLVFTFLKYLAERARSFVWVGDPWAMMLPFLRPETGALQIFTQYMGLIAVCLACYLVFGKKERLLSEMDEGGLE